MEYEDLIREKISDAKDISLISETNNKVYKVEKDDETLFAKFYLNRSSHIDHEMQLYGIIDNKYLKDIVCSSEEPQFTIFKELKGTTIDKLSDEAKQANAEKVVSAVIDFYSSCEQHKLEGFGLVDKDMKGESESFADFITKRQLDTQNVLKDYPIVNNAFTRIYEKYGDKLTIDNSIVPIDTNMKNIMLTEDGAVKFIDPGEIISAPILMGYGDFLAHTYKTPFGDELLKRLNLNEEQEKELRIYAVFSLMNVLAFLKNLGVDDLQSQIPYGNKITFFDLISEHLDYLSLGKDKEIER